MNQKLFYSCSLFDDKDFVIAENFTVAQNELFLSTDPNVHGASTKFKFAKMKVEYKCKWTKQDNWSSKKPTLLIPIRNNKKLIDYTIANLKETNLVKHCNVIIIDDRSTENIQSSALENNLSYLRVDNSKGFNFSMLNNIAAKICYDLGNETIILWNSDLWCVKEEWFLSLLKKHKKSGSWVSGSKLVYPPKERSLNKDDITENIKDNFPKQTLSGKWRNTIQYGGSSWMFVELPDHSIRSTPVHHRRFADLNDPLASCDKRSSILTGALHIWNLEKYIYLGGFNPTLSKNFQDIDLCLKATVEKHPPWYFGKDIYFYHDESYNFYNNKDEKKYDRQMKSDHIIFDKIWNEKIPSLVF